MKTKGIIGALTLLLALVLVSAAVVPTVCATEKPVAIPEPPIGKPEFSLNDSFIPEEDI